MADFINKVITIILIFIMLILAPMMLSYTSSDMVTERLVLNEVSQFIDRVTDKGGITSQDMDDLYLGVNSHGGLYEVKVDRFIRVAYEDNESGVPIVKTTYYRVNDEIDDLYKTAGSVARLNITDVVKVHVEEIGMSSGKRLLWSVLKVDKGLFKFSLAGTVR